MTRGDVSQDVGQLTGGATDLVRAIAAEPTLEEAMRRLSEYAAHQIGGADAAGLTVPTDGGPVTRAATAGLADTADALQYALGGPCVTALVDPNPVQLADDLNTDERWPEFATAAVQQTPVRSVLSFRLAVDHQPPIASLNLYSTRPRAFAAAVVRETTDLAAQAAIALAYLIERQTRLELDGALRSNRRIGAAVGVLMARHRLTHDQALTRLREESQHTNRKLRDLADDILDTGDMPALSRRG